MTLIAALCLLAWPAPAQRKPPHLEALEPLPGKALPGDAGAMALPAGKPPPLPPGAAGVAPSAGRRQAASGTGFVVARGRVLTNHHVVAGCAELRLRSAGEAEFAATPVATDRERNLALLAVPGDPGPALGFRGGREPRRGEGVVTYGFPLAGLLSSGPTLTTGEVSALAGLRDDPRQIQISAPVQPGNSGGPLLDGSGLVIGVVVSKLNAQSIAQATGDIPQNVNFAVRGAEAVEFLRRNGVQPRLVGTAARLGSAADVGEVAHPSTLFLRCLW